MAGTVKVPRKVPVVQMAPHGTLRSDPGATPELETSCYCTPTLMLEEPWAHRWHVFRITLLTSLFHRFQYSLDSKTTATSRRLINIVINLVGFGELSLW